MLDTVLFYQPISRLFVGEDASHHLRTRIVNALNNFHVNRIASQQSFQRMTSSEFRAAAAAAIAAICEQPEMEIADLCALTEVEVCSICGIGKKGLALIKRRLAANGLKLAMPECQPVVCGLVHRLRNSVREMETTARRLSTYIGPGAAA